MILAGQRPLPSAEFASELDERVARRFAPAPVAGTKRARRWWVFAPGAAIAVAAAAAVAVVISGGGQPARIEREPGSSYRQLVELGRRRAGAPYPRRSQQRGEGGPVGVWCPVDRFGLRGSRFGLRGSRFGLRGSRVLVCGARAVARARDPGSVDRRPPGDPIGAAVAVDAAA